jgi:hypothetical protein
MRRIWWALAVGALVAGAVACGDDDTSASSSTSAAPSPSTSPDGTEETEVRVYFSRDEKVSTAGRAVASADVERAAVEMLLEGTDAFETDIGMTSAIPEGTELLDVTVDDGHATVDLSSEFASGGGSLSMQLRVAQIVFTLTQFDAVESVTILLDGQEPTEGIGGEGVPAIDLDRTDVENVIPFVLVESPVPNELVASPLTVQGISNTFESTVLYTITDPEGLILEEGFTTATAGNGVWGDFSVEVELTTERSGLGAVIAFQEDPESGEQRDVYEVPVRMG